MKLFDTRWWLKPICEKITKHKNSELIGYDESFEKRNFKYPNRSDFFYKCKICGYVYFTHYISKKDLERIKNEERNRRF